MVDASKLLGVNVMTGHWEFTYGAERVKQIVNSDLKGKIDFVAQNVTLGDFGEPVFQPYTIKSVSGVPIAIIGQAFPYTPVAHPRYFTPDWTFGIQEENLKKWIADARKRGAKIVVLLSHNGMDIDLKLARAGRWDQCHSGRPHSRRRSPAGAGQERPGLHPRHQCWLQRQVPRHPRPCRSTVGASLATSTAWRPSSRICSNRIGRWTHTSRRFAPPSRSSCASGWRRPRVFFTAATTSTVPSTRSSWMG